jgi:hypothetical protein
MQGLPSAVLITSVKLHTSIVLSCRSNPKYRVPTHGYSCHTPSSPPVCLELGSWDLSRRKRGQISSLLEAYKQIPGCREALKHSSLGPKLKPVLVQFLASGACKAKQRCRWAAASLIPGDGRRSFHLARPGSTPMTAQSSPHLRVWKYLRHSRQGQGLPALVRVTG